MKIIYAAMNIYIFRGDSLSQDFLSRGRRRERARFIAPTVAF